MGRERNPNWTRRELDVVRTDWPAGVPMDEMLRKLPNRTPRAIQTCASKLGLRRPYWYTKNARSVGGRAGAMVALGRRDFWSAAATERLLQITKEHSVEEAARVCRVSVEQAKGRLYRIGWRAKPETPPEPDEPEYLQPTLPDADRVAALVARFDQPTIGA